MMIVVGLIFHSCSDSLDNSEEIKKTPFHSYNYLFNEEGDTLVNFSYDLEDYGGYTIGSSFGDILATISGFDRELMLWGTNFTAPKLSIRDTIRTYYQVKYFTLEEMNLKYYNHGDLMTDEVVEFIRSQNDNVNKEPYKVELLYNYIDPVNEIKYTNKNAKAQFILEEYRYHHEQAGLEVDLDSITKFEAHGYLNDGKWMEFLRLKGSSKGFLHDERNWLDSIYIEGEFDLLFGVNDTEFQ